MKAVRGFGALAYAVALLVASGVVPATVGAQAWGPADSARITGLRWRSLGPAIAGGRVTTITVDPRDADVIYVGSASGGVFKTTNDAATWTPVFDHASNLSVGAIALAPSDPDEVWVGTGEANNRNSSPFGAGLYRSLDGGQSFSFVGLGATRHIGRIAVDPRDPDVVYVAALGHLFGPNPERGLYRTRDGGKTWQKVLYIDDNTGVVDVALNPANPNIVYAAAYQRRRRAWGFDGGGPGSGLYRSVDGGDSWEKLTKGLPAGAKGRIGLAVWPGDPNLVLALVQARGGGLFRSEDRGTTWTKVNDLDPRPMYYSQVRIDPSDRDRIYVLGTRLYRSDDGGKSFHTLALEKDYNLGAHVDNHALWIDPRDSRHLLLGNDGGFYASRDRGKTWRFPANLPIEQFYDVALDMATPYHIYGGLQDNNSYEGPSATRRWQGIMNRDWSVVDFGDGMYAAADPTDPHVAYASSQGGAILRIDPITGDRKSIQPVPPDTSTHYRFDWTSPILLSPHDPNTVYLGGNRLFISHDRGDSWTATKDLSRGIPQDSLPIMGGLTDSTTLSRNDGTASYGEITTISESPVQAGVLWAGTDDGNVQVSRDDGKTWTEVGGRLPGVPRRMVVSRVEASHAAAGRAYVSLDGHWDDDYRPWLFVTDDYGRSWKSLGAGLAADSATTVDVVREHPDNPNLLLVGAENGVYASLDAGVHWFRLGLGMPHVAVKDLEIHPRDDDLVAASHGRGVWILDDIGALAGMSPAVAAAPLHVFSVRPSTLFQYRNGVPPLGEEAFMAPNPPFGAVIDYSLASDLPGGVSVRFRDARDSVVRTLHGPSTAGIHRLVWDLRRDPLPMDTTRFEPPALDVGPQGPLVMAGRYTAELDALGDTATTTLEVRTDPLHPVPEAEQETRYAFTLALYRLERRAYDAALRSRALREGATAAVKAFRDRKPADAAVLARVDSMARVVSKPDREIARVNLSLRNWWRGLIGQFDGGSSTQGTMTGPTPGQERRLGWLRDRLTTALGDLDEAIGKTLPELNRALATEQVLPVQVPPTTGAGADSSRAGGPAATAAQPAMAAQPAAGGG